MYLDGGGLVFHAERVERVQDSGFVLEVLLDDGNWLRFTGMAARGLRTQLNLLLEGFLSWQRERVTRPGDFARCNYTWTATAERARTSAPPSTT